MARLLARTVTLARPAMSRSSLRALSAKVEFVEIDLSEESPSSSGVAGDSTEEAAVMGMRRLEDANHGLLLRRSAPEWLPFVSGGSYWVPPMRRPLGVSDLLGNSKAVYTVKGASVDASAMTEEEAMSFTTARGWPSAAYFVQELMGGDEADDFEGSTISERRIWKVTPGSHNPCLTEGQRYCDLRDVSQKNCVDPFTKKDWYDIKAPSVFSVRDIGRTIVSRTQGTKIASEGLKHRVFEVSLADLQSDEDQAHRKIRLRAEDVEGRNVLTNFWGMDFTTDKLRSLVRKWQTLIEAHVDVKTTDNYMLRLFCIGFTKRRPNQVKRTCYAQASRIRQIRFKMVEIMACQACNCDLKELVSKFIPVAIGKEI